MSTSPASQASVNDIPAVEDLYQRARDYQEILIGRAKETAELRRLPDETIKDFHDLGFLCFFFVAEHRHYFFSLFIISKAFLPCSVCE